MSRSTLTWGRNSTTPTNVAIYWTVFVLEPRCSAHNCRKGCFEGYYRGKARCTANVETKCGEIT
jgi:hypothetical protein